MHTGSSQFGRGLESPLSAPASLGLGDVPLFHAAWLYAAGIAIAQGVRFSSSFVLIACVLAAILCACAAFRAQRIAWMPLGLLWCLLGAWCAQMEPGPSADPALAAMSNGLLRTVEGTVAEAGAIQFGAEQDLDEPQAAPSASQRLDLRLSTIERVADDADLEVPVSGNIRLTVRWPRDDHLGIAGQRGERAFQCGDRLRAVTRLLGPETYHDPGVWSREEFLVEQGITATATVGLDRVERVAKSPGTSLACRFSAWQHASTDHLLALPQAMRRLPAPFRLSPQDAAMLAAMVAGDRTYLTHSLRAGFERTGSFHMLVVSGFHLAIVAGCVFWVAKRIHLSRVPATLLTIAASFIYAVFTGFATPVQRSLWMVALYLLARLLFRERSPLNTVGFAALCLLAASPRSLFDASFQMTLLAVVSIAGIAAPLLASTIHPYVSATHDLRRIAIDVKLPPNQAQFRVTLRILISALENSRVERFAWRAIPSAVRCFLRLIELLTVSCIVELAMTLPMALYFHRITIFALPVNLFILPLLLILMPGALVTLLTALIWPAAAAIPAMFVALPLHFSVWLVHLFGSMTLGDFRIPAPLLSRSMAFCALLAAAMLLARGSRWYRRAAWAALLLAALAGVIPRPIQHPHNALLVEAIDVGQGDSLLLISPDGKTLVVDGGGFGGGPHQAPQDFDIGEEVVSEVLWARGIRRLDAVALSHAHSDHMGGLPAVLRNFRPSELWVGNNPSSPDYLALLKEASTLGVRIRTFRAGDAVAFGDTQIAVLAPFRDYRPGPEPSNNDSLVLHVSFGATSVLLEGDAEAPVEQAMLAEPGLASTLLKVGHHGSATSTRPEFLARVAPQWAVISCGLHNRYGHPRPEVLNSLEAAQVRTYSTDINGATCFALDGKSVTPDAACGWQREP
jgi:competence protein ComEC